LQFVVLHIICVNRTLYCAVLYFICTYYIITCQSFVVCIYYISVSLRLSSRLDWIGLDWIGFDDLNRMMYDVSIHIYIHIYIHIHIYIYIYIILFCCCCCCYFSWLVGWQALLFYSNNSTRSTVQHSTAQYSITNAWCDDDWLTDWLTDDIENRKAYINFYYLRLSAFFILYCYWGLLYCTVFVIISQCHDVCYYQQYQTATAIATATATTVVSCLKDVGSSPTVVKFGLIFSNYLFYYLLSKIFIFFIIFIWKLTRVFY
jgi:hypothetical protein